MASYGFKLLKVNLRLGQGQSDLDWSPDDGPPYLDLLINDIAAARARRDAAEAGRERPTVTTRDEDTGDEEAVFQDDVVRTSDHGDGTRVPDSVVRLDDSARMRSALLITVQYGIVGDHQRAVDPNGLRGDTDLTGLATTRTYRVMLIAPEHGTNGFLAVEVISRSNPAADLPRRLFNAAEGHRFKLKPAGPVADERSIQELARTGVPREVELFKTIIGSDSATPTTRKVTMKFPIAVGASEARDIMDRVRGWIARRSGRGETVEAIIPATEAAALAGILWQDVAALEFDDARVRLESDSAPGRRLMPLDPKEGFVYDLGDDEPDDNAFIYQVASVSQSLFRTYEMDMPDDWAQDL